VYPGDLAEPMQLNWSPFIAPYRSVLIDRDSGTFRVSFGATNRNIWTNGSGRAVACFRPHYATSGTVSSQQTTSPVTSTSVLQPSVTVTIPRDKSNSVSGLVNFMRNLGSSFGTSAVTTILAQRTQFHQVRLTEHTATGDVNFQNMLSGTAQTAQSIAGNGHVDANQVGMARIYQTVQDQASALSYLDVFHVLMVIGGAMFFLSFLLRGNKPKKQAIAAH
jgi:hypothetical protein